MRVFSDAPFLVVLIAYAVYMIAYNWIVTVREHLHTCRHLRARLAMLRAMQSHDSAPDALPHSAVKWPVDGGDVMQVEGPVWRAFQNVHSVIQTSCAVYLIALAVHGVWLYW